MSERSELSPCSCNKYCDLTGQLDVSISHRDLLHFHRDLQVSVNVAMGKK